MSVGGEDGRATAQIALAGVRAGTPIAAGWSGHSLTGYQRRDGQGSGFVQVPLRSPQSSVHRSLISESHVVFEQLQRAVEESSAAHPEAPGRLSPEQCAGFSGQFRATLRSCVVQLNTALQQATDPPDELFDQRSNYAVMDLVWHLGEIFFVRAPHLVSQSGFVLLELLSWAVQHFPDVNDDLRQVVAPTSQIPEAEPAYWPTVYRLMFQGRLGDVRQLLQIHTQRQHGLRDPFAVMEELLEGMPRMYQGGSGPEFVRLWYDWQQHCKKHLETTFRQQGELETMCSILCGNEHTLASLAEYAQTWYQLLIAKLLYTNPLVKVFDLERDIQWALGVLSATPSTKLDSILQAVFDQDVLKVIRDSSECFPDWWFAAHFADLVTCAGWLEPQQLPSGRTLRDFLVLEYASDLFAHHGQWAAGAAYFASCGESGLAQLGLHVERLPLTSERKADKVLHLCRKYGLHDEATSICRVLGRRAVSQGRIGTALGWSLRAKDSAAVTQLADRMLREYVETGELATSSVIDNFGVAMLLSERLTFLAKYKEFHKILKRGEVTVASESLIKMLTNDNMAPRWFLVHILMDALPLLEYPELVFNASQTKLLLRVLEELVQSHRADDYLPKNNAHKLETLRLALARNLARAIVLAPAASVAGEAP